MATITVSLPKKTVSEMDRAAKLDGFASRSEFIRNLLRKHFSPDVKFEAFSRRSLAEIKRDLSLSGKYDQQFINSVIKGLEKSSVYESKTSKS